MFQPRKSKLFAGNPAKVVFWWSMCPYEAHILFSIILLSSLTVSPIFAEPSLFLKLKLAVSLYVEPICGVLWITSACQFAGIFIVKYPSESLNSRQLICLSAGLF